MYKITQKVIDGFQLNFQDSFGMIQGPIDYILVLIRKESWILDHFELIHDHSPGGGLRSADLFADLYISLQ